MSVEKVKEYFKGTDVEDRIAVRNSPSDTVEHAAQVCGCTVGEIAKTMSFMLSSGPILIISAGDMKINNSKFKAFFGEKARMIPFDDVERIIGHAPGGVCPFAVNEGVKVYLDESIFRFKDLHIAAGSDNATINLTTDEIEKYSNAAGRIDVCKPIEG